MSSYIQVATCDCEMEGEPKPRGMRPRPNTAPPSACDLDQNWRVPSTIKEEIKTPYTARDEPKKNPRIFDYIKIRDDEQTNFITLGTRTFRIIEGGIHGIPCDEFGPEHLDQGFIGYVTGKKRLTSNDDPKPNLIVNYLPQKLKDRDFFHMFAPFGIMNSIKIMRDAAVI